MVPEKWMKFLNGAHKPNPQRNSAKIEAWPLCITFTVAAAGFTEIMGMAKRVNIMMEKFRGVYFPLKLCHSALKELMEM